MHSYHRSKVLLAAVLIFTISSIGCSTQWTNLALADLPVLVQMGLNIATFTNSLNLDGQVSPAEAAEIQRISDEATRDLSLLQTLCREYKARPSNTNLSRIQNAIADLQRNLPALLHAAHIGNPTLAARVTSAVTLIQSTIASFAALIAGNAAAQAHLRERTATPAAQGRQDLSVIRPTELKKQWNTHVCTPSGGPTRPALASCTIK